MPLHGEDVGRELKLRAGTKEEYDAWQAALKPVVDAFGLLSTETTTEEAREPARRRSRGEEVRRREWRECRHTRGARTDP